MLETYYHISYHTVHFRCSASEVLREEILTVAFGFDGNLQDSDLLLINGTGVNYAFTIAGRSNQNRALMVSESYVQARGLVLFGTSSYSYPFALFIKSYSVTPGTILHVSRLATGLGWCIPMSGFTSAGSVTYSSTNGLCLYVNGSQSGSSSSVYAYSAAGAPVAATLGSSLAGTSICSAGNIAMGQYYGYMDQFQLYSRELTASFVATLANS